MQIQNPMMFVRSIKGAPSSILWVLVLVRQALTIRQFCAYTDYKPDTVREAIEVLIGYEMVVENKLAHGEAVFSLGKGYQFLLPGLNLEALGRVEQMAGVDPESEKIGLCVDGVEPGEIQSPKKSDSGENGSEKSSKNSEKSIQSPKKSDSGWENPGSIMMIDDDESLTNIDSSSIMNPPGENLPSVETLLEAMGTLQGWKGHPREEWGVLDLADIPAETKSHQLLAWLVKVFKDSPRLENPPGLLRRRLCGKSQRNLPKDWKSQLPLDYLVAIGMAEADPETPSGAKLDSDSDQVDETSEDDFPVLDNPLIVRVWETILGQLQGEMPRASFDTWVRQTKPVAWDDAGKTLTVAAWNNYARDWLENRLTSTIQRLLAGMMNCAIELQFVTVEEFKKGEQS